MDRDSEARLAIKRDFAAFLDAEGAAGGSGGVYAAKIGALLSVPGGVPARGARLDVDLQDLAGVAPDLHARLMDDPADCIPAFEEVRNEIFERWKEKKEERSAGFEKEKATLRIHRRLKRKKRKRRARIGLCRLFFFFLLFVVVVLLLSHTCFPLFFFSFLFTFRPSTRSPARTTPRPCRLTRGRASASDSRVREREREF